MVDEHGRVKVAGLMPETLPEPVRQALADIDVGGGPGDPEIDANWGNPQLSLSEKVFGWNTLDVLAFKTGGVVSSLGVEEGVEPGIDLVLPHETVRVRAVVGVAGQRGELDAEGAGCA